MPNWVKNIVHIEGPAEDIVKVIELMRDKEPANNNCIDFENIMAIPKSLKITSGGYDRYYVAMYLKTFSEAEKRYLRAKLSNRQVGYYGNYFTKYAESFTADIPNGTLKRMHDTFMTEYKDISPSCIEDVGKSYITNILEYGDDTWYEWCIRNWGTKWNACDGTITENGFEFSTAWSAPFPIIATLSRRFPKLTFSHEWADENLGYNCGQREFKNGIVVSEDYPDDGDEAHEFACTLWGYDPDEFDDE